MGNGEGQDGQREMRRRKRDKDLVREKVGRLGGAHSQDFVEMSKYKNWDGKGRGDVCQLAVPAYGDTVQRRKATEVHSHDMSDSVAMDLLLDLEERGLAKSAHPPGEDLLTLWPIRSKPASQ